jgi:hypothetical protein
MMVIVRHHGQKKHIKRSCDVQCGSRAKGKGEVVEVGERGVGGGEGATYTLARDDDHPQLHTLHEQRNLQRKQPEPDVLGAELVHVLVLAARLEIPDTPSVGAPRKLNRFDKFLISCPTKEVCAITKRVEQ